MMSSFLPPLVPAGQGTKKEQGISAGSLVEKLKNKILIKLPPWEQNTCLKNWEPLNPPSPYQQVVRKRVYPSVISKLQEKRRNSSRSMGRALEMLDVITDEFMNSSGDRLLQKEQEEAQIRRIMNEETEWRSTVIFNEQYERTHIWVEMLRDLGVLLEGDIQAAEENVREACRRDDERFRMCYAIEMYTTLDRSQERFKAELRKQFSQLMPLYKEIYGRIVEEEKEDLKSIFAWSKRNRPFGMRFPVEPDGNNLKVVKKRAPPVVRNNARAVQKKILRYLPTTIVAEASNSSFPGDLLENSYVEEGRRAWRAIKNIRGLERKGLGSTREVEEMESAVRDTIRSEESTLWMPITAQKLDEYCKSKQAESEREREEMALIDEQLEELQKREAIRLRLECEAMYNKKAEVELKHRVPTLLPFSETSEGVKMFQKIQREKGVSEEMEHKSMSDEPQVNSGNEEEAHERGALPADTTAGEAPDEGHLWSEDSTETPLFPKLNMVLGVALEADALAALRSSLFSALGEAECALAAVEGRGAGHIAKAFALASHVPLCPAYLSTGLWCDTPRAVCEGAVAREEATARRRLERDQMDAVWRLYQTAAVDASQASGVECGEAYYIGVRLPAEYLEMK